MPDVEPQTEVPSQRKVTGTEQEMDEPQMRDDTAADGEAELSPQQTAHLIKQTSREAKRQFGYWQSPWLTLGSAAVFLVVHGTLWLSVRGQRPYTGPTGWALLTPSARCSSSRRSRSAWSQGQDARGRA